MLRGFAREARSQHKVKHNSETPAKRQKHGKKYAETLKQTQQKHRIHDFLRGFAREARRQHKVKHNSETPAKRNKHNKNHTKTMKTQFLKKPKCSKCIFPQMRPAPRRGSRPHARAPPGIARLRGGAQPARLVLSSLGWFSAC